MVSLHVEAATVNDLIDSVEALIGLKFQRATASESVPQTVPAPAPATAEPVNDGKKKPGRPPKAAQPADEPQKVAPSADPSAPSTPAHTGEVTEAMVKASLQKLAAQRADESNEVGGLNRVFELINTFKTADGTPCRKIKELQPADYKAVYEKAEAANKVAAVMA